ncbi:ABC transporter permease [Halobaculum gomorrense]|uniref:Nucleoside ABC transporter membrane protein n=1 Tax=Halobaculum gomorrense TaxID=43928 RepID=A0A1M5N5Q8_9EURY|nr:ABC transporter permease [Halobaculum gomorrense]SHG84910.1 nucleoside ABC transporter membrane protein [Halobaculum gomorrense]
MSATAAVSDLGTRARLAVAGAAALFLSAGALALTGSTDVLLAVLALLFEKSTLAAALRLSVPIAFAALGGIFAEKSGVINIGLEGLLIVSAFGGVYVTSITGSVWLGLLGGVAVSTLLALLFAIVCIEFRADQIIAGLAIWLIALGLAPFASTVVFGSTNASAGTTFPSIGRLLANSGLPVVSTAGVAALDALAGVPFFGALFEASPMVYLMFVAVGASWWTLNRTSFGRWVHASGENPKALDTAGVRVSRVRYAAVLLSGVLAGVGGAALSLSLGQFVGNGPTMVNGKGFIAIVTYLLGNYNPVGALLSTLLFAGLDALQLSLQGQNVLAIPRPLVRTIPYVSVIVVLALFGKTRLPEAAGEHYESGEE